MNRRRAATVIRWLREMDITKRLVTITYQAITQITHPRFGRQSEGSMVNFMLFCAGGKSGGQISIFDIQPSAKLNR